MASVYIVWCKDGGTPTVAHTERGRAVGEAKRLARANRGAEFIVFRAVESYQVNDLQRTEFADELGDEIPF